MNTTRDWRSDPTWDRSRGNTSQDWSCGLRSCRPNCCSRLCPSIRPGKLGEGCYVGACHSCGRLGVDCWICLYQSKDLASLGDDSDEVGR